MAFRSKVLACTSKQWGPDGATGWRTDRQNVSSHNHCDKGLINGPLASKLGMKVFKCVFKSLNKSLAPHNRSGAWLLLSALFKLLKIVFWQSSHFWQPDWARILVCKKAQWRRPETSIYRQHLTMGSEICVLPLMCRIDKLFWFVACFKWRLDWITNY